MMNGMFCGEAWGAVSRYVYSALQGGSIMNDNLMMIGCCNAGTRSVIFNIARIGIPELLEADVGIARQNIHNSVEDTYTG